MPAKTFEHVKGSELPVSLLEGFGACFPEQTFRVTIEFDTDPETDDERIARQRREVIDRGKARAAKIGMSTAELIQSYKDDHKW
ncbi:MAG: hypothetical protein HQK60_20260 [Deltaproteobacteria bacterium]|nr:hypothetical protein [Deltaproteobacteria bacterium]